MCIIVKDNKKCTHVERNKDLKGVTLETNFGVEKPFKITSCPETVKKSFVSSTPRLRHDCVISNDVGSVARKGPWYSDEGFHSR